LIEYFIRHGSGGSSSIAVPDETINKLWKENKIAIHFPGPRDQDSSSLDPRDYIKPKAKYAIEVFSEINDNGGYVMAHFRTKPDRVKIGIIMQNSFEPMESVWTTIPGRIAILKTLQFKTEIPHIRIDNVQELWSKIHRRKTLVRWRSASGKLKDLILSNM